MENSLSKSKNHAWRNAAMAILGVSAGLLGAAHVANADTVTAQAGDSLWKISQAKGVSVDQLKQMNNLQSDTIMVGQQLNVSSDQVSATTQNGQAKFVVVKAGDTLSSIASANGTTVDNIKQLNHLTSDLIVVGQQLQVAGDAQQAQQPAQAPQQASQAPQANTQAASQQTQAPAASSNSYSGNSNYTAPSLGGSEQAAKDAIAQAESGGSYSATNGQYIGKYQLSSSYLNGDYSPANQERVADQYVANRYGSWTNALNFRNAHGWY